METKFLLKAQRSVDGEPVDCAFHRILTWNNLAVVLLNCLTRPTNSSRFFWYVHVYEAHLFFFEQKLKHFLDVGNRGGWRRSVRTLFALECYEHTLGRSRLTLAEDVKTNDGTFDFVGARGEDRGFLLDYFDARIEVKRRKFPLRAKRFTKMRLRWKKWPLHFDDALWPAKDEEPAKKSEIELIVKDSALRIWRIE
jgi:hypothetical protein